MHIFAALVQWSHSACRFPSEDTLETEITRTGRHILQGPPTFVGNSPFPKASEIWGRNHPALRPLKLQDGWPSVDVTWGLHSSTLCLIGFLSVALWQSAAFTELQAATCKRCQSRRTETVTWAHLLLLIETFEACRRGRSQPQMFLKIYQENFYWLLLLFIFVHFQLYIQ